MDPSKSDATQIGGDDPAPTHASDPDMFALDDWQWDDELRQVDRLARSLRLDAPHAGGPPRPAMTERAKPKATEARQPQRRGRKSGTITVAWGILSLGVAAFIFGGALLGWSFVANRGDLWAWGMPVTLGGQALLLIGVVLQLDRLWANHCDTAEVLDGLDRQIDGLRQMTSAPGSTQATAAQSLYAQPAGGAHPQMLLADLKGQLDILAMRLAQQRC